MTVSTEISSFLCRVFVTKNGMEIESCQTATPQDAVDCAIEMDTRFDDADFSVRLMVLNATDREMTDLNRIIAEAGLDLEATGR
jgi:hypothetical protein